MKRYLLAQNIRCISIQVGWRGTRVEVDLKMRYRNGLNENNNHKFPLMDTSDDVSDDTTDNVSDDTSGGVYDDTYDDEPLMILLNE